MNITPAKMEDICVLMTRPMSAYLERELEKRFTLLKPWESTSRAEFLNRRGVSVRAVVGDTKLGVDSELIESLPHLEIVASFSVGLDKIDLDRCRGKGIRVTNTPDVLTDDVADVAIGLALAVSRRICAADVFVRGGLWRNGHFELATKFSGKSIGIIGLGRIGSAIAKRAAAFDCTIGYHSRTKKPNTNYKYYPNILGLAADSQILFISCTLTDETVHIVSRQVIDALGPAGILINVGRGRHVDQKELVLALCEGRLGGAGLDVFENEPNVPEVLLGLENVVLLPHVGSDSVETSEAMADLVVSNLESYFLGKPLLTPVV